MSKNFYTAEQDEWLKAHINDCKWDELVRRFNEKFQQQRTKTAIKRHCWGVLHIISDRNGCFEKGHTPHNINDIGAEMWENGYLWVKVNNIKGEHGSHHAYRQNWKQKHYVVWEEAYGKIPEGKQIVFLDGDRTNFDLNNLYCVDLQVMAVMNRNKWFTDNRENTLTAIKWCELHFALKEKVTMAEKEYIERGAALDAITYNPIEKPTEPDIVELTLLTAQKQIRKVPAADVVEVVRCKDCEYWENGKNRTPYCCNIDGLNEPDANDFCSYGERKEQK